MSELLRNASRALFAFSAIAIISATLLVTAGVFATPFHAFVVTPLLILGGAAMILSVDGIITESWPLPKPTSGSIRAVPVPAC
jgi:hypothetical protein